MNKRAEKNRAPPRFLAVDSRDDELGQRIWRWDLSHVRRRVAARMGWDSRYSIGIEKEYRRFVFLSVKYMSKNLGMSGPVDEFWHDHILHTKDYVEFCSQIAGRYLHHVPTPEGGKDGSSYLNTLALLEKHFGTANWQVWPKAVVAKSDCCSPCSHITHAGASPVLSDAFPDEIIPLLISRSADLSLPSSATRR